MHHPLPTAFSTDTIRLTVFSFEISCFKTRTSNMAQAHFAQQRKKMTITWGQSVLLFLVGSKITSVFYLAINAVGHNANPKSICVRFASAAHHTAS